MSAISHKLAEVIADALRLPFSMIHANMSMENTEAWDSLAHMELIVSLECRFGLSLSADEIVELLSVEKIQRLLESKGVAA